jgi:paraquat-inducible protein B
MREKVNPALIGAFVLGAIALAVVAVVILASGRFFADTRTFVMFFEGSVGGLRIGASVTFRGVRVGSVTDIQIAIDPNDLSHRVPVYVVLDLNRVVWTGQRPEQVPTMNQYIRRGLRAQLRSESLVTGQLLVNLDFAPDTPVKLVGMEIRFQEIPTIPSPLEELSRRIEDLPLKELVSSAQKIIEGVEHFVNAPAVTDTLRNADATLTAVRGAVERLERETGRIAGDLSGITGDLRQALTQIEKSVTDTIGDYQKVARDANAQLERVTGTIESLSRRIEGLPLEDLVTSATRMTQGIDRVVGSPEFAALVPKFGDTMAQVRKLAQTADVQGERIGNRIDALARKVEALQVEDLVAAATRTVQGVDKLVNDPRTAAMLATLDDALRDLQRLAQDANRQLSEATTQLNVLFRRFEQMPIETMVVSATRMTESIDRIASSPEATAAIATLNKTLAEIEALARTANEQVTRVGGSFDILARKLDSLALDDLIVSTTQMTQGIDRLTSSPEVTGSLRAFSETLREYQKLARTIDGQVAQVMTRVGTAFAQGERTMTGVQQFVAPNSQLYVELGNALRELTAASRSIRALADYLERNPDALLRGKNLPGSR